MSDDSRARILHTALDLFAERGYHRVSIREIAEQVGLTKTAVLYHFPSKGEIAATLAEPLLSETEAALAAAQRAADPNDRRWAVVEGLVDVWLSHGQLLRMQMQDQALSANTATFTRLRDIALTAQELIAGPAADFATRVRAAQVFAALSDPITIFADQPAAELRTAILDGVRRLLDAPPPQRHRQRPDNANHTPPTPANRGRPVTMTTDMAESARRMRVSGDYTMDEIASELGVSRATLYRRLSIE